MGARRPSRGREHSREHHRASVHKTPTPGRNTVQNGQHMVIWSLLDIRPGFFERVSFDTSALLPPVPHASLVLPSKRRT